MRGFRSHIASFFLICLLALSLPREWVHTHHTEDAVSFHHAADSGYEQDCAVCDFHFTAEEASLPGIPVAQCTELTSEPVYSAAVITLNKPEDLLNKAPPVLPV